MVRTMLTVTAALAACTPSPPESAMTSRSSTRDTAERHSGESSSGGMASSAPGATDDVALRHDRTDAPSSPGSAAHGSATAQPADSLAESDGRRTLSTAFVRIGADGVLTVDLRDGRVVVLRNVVMRAKDYCGLHVAGRSAGATYCGGYAEIAAARAGGAAPRQPDLAEANPVALPTGQAKRD